MHYRFFSIPAMMPDDMPDDMNRFCAEHRVISIEKQFVQDGDRSSGPSACVMSRSMPVHYRLGRAASITGRCSVMPILPCL